MRNVEFEQERVERLQSFQGDVPFQDLSRSWLQASMERKYVYNFDWMGRPIIQYPQDMVAVQELVWSVRPDVIIETGIAHGGSLVLSASLLALLDMADAIAEKRAMDPTRSSRRVIGVDIDIRPHNREAIEAHPMASRIQLIQGSSVDSDTIRQVRDLVPTGAKVMVFLDSMHTHAHVLQELEAYAPLVSIGSYCVVFDTFVEDMPPQFFSDRPWDVGNSPKTAVQQWLRGRSDFEIDLTIQTKLMVTVAPSGFLRRVA